MMFLPLHEDDWRIIMGKKANALNILVNSAYTILTELELSNLSDQCFPKLLCPDQLQIRVRLSTEKLNNWDQDPEVLLQRTVTGDKK